MANLQSSENILFIVEGEKTEPNLIYHLQRAFKVETKYNIYSYETSIYELYDALVKDEYLDIILLLKELTRDAQKRLMLSNKFSKIFLLFDFDPHHQKYEGEKIKSMLEMFKDSTDGGKLYINYPMTESFRHLKHMPDLKFITRRVNSLEIMEYKSHVDQCSAYSNLTKLNYSTARDMLIHHLSKLEYILHSKKVIDDDTCYDVDSKSSIDLLIKQIENSKQDRLYVIHTGILYLVDILQAKFIKSLHKRQIKFD